MGSLRFVNSQSIIDGDMSGDISGTSVDISYCKVVGIQAIWDSGASPTGSVGMQFSNDGGTTWTSYGAGAAVSGNSGNAVFVVPATVASAIPFQLARAAFSQTGGTGNLNVYLSAKQ